ncbi:MAG: metalloprotease PmbA [Gammaproteobacteria bacterium]|nr:metalloprotease PmbA [Rhodocyclaceae bacterium]MBU3908295.1 metalloprotease PmbA [Gammaproteobacteria bacterium]MBU4003068.1 metalloprotease PmbA [Gammaproteobacteria bacterium]MBU4019910.1 metalloprotease PmbA [Gammaproteobacteria bacterium]MBU4096924.1 metalloprotease PmbA [Gammaproteobacteria bacterium]
MSEFSFTPDQLRQLATDVLQHARQGGASACETDVSEGFGQSVTVRKGEVETIEFNRDKGIGVSVYLGQQRGHASTSDFSPASIKATVDAALSIARFTAADPCAGLPAPELLAKNVADMDLDLYHPWPLPVEEAIALARRSEQAAFAVSPLINNSEGASVSAHAAHFISANSLGFMGGYPSTRHYLSCVPIASKGKDMQRDDWYSGWRDPADLAAPELIGDYAARRTLSRLGAKKLKTRQCKVMLEAPLAAMLLGSFVHAVSGGSLYRKASFLLDTLGQRIFPDWFSIEERPHLKKGLASSLFDDDGVATHDRTVVANGVLQGYFLSTYTARKLNMQTTGNAGGSHNLIVAPSPDAPADFAGLLRQMGTGLLVTELLGHGINYVTGDYSRGAVGYWVEGGEVAYPVHEITIAGNLRDMFAGIETVGRDSVTRGSRSVGSIVVNRMTVAGN